MRDGQHACMASGMSLRQGPSFWDFCELFNGFACYLSLSIKDDRSGAILYMMSHMINLF